MESSVTERRRHPRRKSFQSQPDLKLRFQDGGDPVELSANVRDVSETGLGLETSRPIPKGTRISVTGDLMAGIRVRRLEGVTGRVASSVRVRERVYAIGIDFDATTSKASADDTQDSTADDRPAVDYYEVMQLNHNADPDTIHRVYRLL